MQQGEYETENKKTIGIQAGYVIIMLDIGPYPELSGSSNFVSNSIPMLICVSQLKSS